MAEKITRLAYIISRLGIRAEEISKRTGIDKTLISRWKSGQRRLSSTSTYSREISSFLLSCDNAESVIKKTLNAYGLDESSGSLQDNFIYWLTEQDKPSPSLRNAAPNTESREYTASFRVFLGEEGLRSAIITLIDYVMTLPPPQNVVAVALSDFKWIMDAPGFFEQLVERMRTAFERGVTLTLISRENFQEEMANFSALWLAAHLRGYIRSYYYKESGATEEKIFIAARDGAALRLEHDTEVEDGLYAAMYTDTVTVRQLYNNNIEYFKKAKMQFRYGFFHKPGTFLHNIPGNTADCYVYTRIPSLGTISRRQAHLYAQKTLRDTKQRTEQVRALFVTPDQFPSQAKVRHIYCQEAVENLLTPGRTVNYPLSALYEKRVHYSRKLILQQLENIRNWLQECENYEVVFLPAHIFEKIPLEFMCVDDSYCAAWSADASDSTCVKDSNKVASLFNFAARRWEDLPKYCRDRNRSLRLLNQWLEDYM